MNQGIELEVVKQEMMSEHQHFRNQWINIDWRCKFNSDGHYIYYYWGQNPLEEME